VGVLKPLVSCGTTNQLRISTQCKMSIDLPKQSQITNPNPNPNADLIDAVRHWVHFDNLAETLTKQVTNARNMRNTFEEKILKLLEAPGLKNAVLQLNGATLQKQTKFKSSDLTWGFLEEQLKDYYLAKGKQDESKQILEFIHKRRGGKNVDSLKKTILGK